MSKTIKIETPDGTAWVRVEDIGAVTVQDMNSSPLLTIRARNGEFFFEARYPGPDGLSARHDPMKDAADIAAAIEREDIDGPRLP